MYHDALRRTRSLVGYLGLRDIDLTLVDPRKAWRFCRQVRTLMRRKRLTLVDAKDTVLYGW